jgi:hypothetical protein
MFIALRRFTLLCTIVLERVMMAKRHDRSTLGAVAIMIGGASPVTAERARDLVTRLGCIAQQSLCTHHVCAWSKRGCALCVKAALPAWPAASCVMSDRGCRSWK